MLGDFAPFEELKQLMEKHPKLRLYIDDAHSTSWMGEHGRGAALEHFARDERVVVALSLNKAFSAAGAALAVPDGELARRIRRCGGPMLFSGPLQPPMLGAAVGSARLHLSPKFPGLQAQVHARIQACSAALERDHSQIELATSMRSTIFQLQCDSPRIAIAAGRAMKERGFYCCLCTFPAVPMNKPGLRFTMCRHNELADIEAFVSALGESVQLAVQRTGTR